MRSISIPFRLDNGVVASTSDPAAIARDEILGVIMTNWFERAMRPYFGGNLRAVIFDANNSINLSEARNVAMSAVQANVTTGRVVNVSFRTDLVQPETLHVDIQYTAPPAGTVQVATAALTGLVTQGDVA